MFGTNGETGAYRELLPEFRIFFVFDAEGGCSSSCIPRTGPALNAAGATFSCLVVILQSDHSMRSHEGMRSRNLPVFTKAKDVWQLGIAKTGVDADVEIVTRDVIDS